MRLCITERRESDRAKMCATHTIREWDALFDLFPFNGTVNTAVSAIWTVVAQDEILIRPKFKNGGTLARKGVDTFRNVGFKKDFAVNKDVTAP